MKESGTLQPLYYPLRIALKGTRCPRFPSKNLGTLYPPVLPFEGFKRVPGSLVSE